MSLKYIIVVMYDWSEKAHAVREHEAVRWVTGCNSPAKPHLEGVQVVLSLSEAMWRWRGG